MPIPTTTATNTTTSFSTVATPISMPIPTTTPPTTTTSFSYTAGSSSLTITPSPSSTSLVTPPLVATPPINTANLNVATNNLAHSVASQLKQHQNKINKTPTPTHQMEIRHSGLPGPGAVSWKRKSLDRDDSQAAKRLKSDHHDDPYAFDDDEPPVMESSYNNKKNSSSSSSSSSSNTSGYKFKNAMLTRGTPPSTPTPVTSSKTFSSNTVFNSSEESFKDTCDKLVDDLNKPNHKIRRRNSSTSSSELKKSPKKKKKESTASLKQQQRALLNEQHQIINQKESLINEAKVKACDKKSFASHSPILANHMQKHKTTLAGLPNNKNSDSSPPPPAPAPVPSQNNEKKKKGTLWALPIVPKLPQKPSSNTVQPPVKPEKEVDTKDVKNVWLQAFGAPQVAKKIEESPTVKKLTYLDIPPEARRRPRPNFGGLIHFAPDWQKMVKTHHENCRIPAKLINQIATVKPKILNSSKNLNLSETFVHSSNFIHNNQNNKEKSSIYDNSSPDDDLVSQPAATKLTLAAFRANSKLGDPFSNINKEINSTSSSNNSGGFNCVVDSILENRKRLRMTMGRMFRVPFMKEKKKKKNTCDDLPTSEGLGLLLTPGLPALAEDTSADGNYGNFRRQTLLRYLDAIDESPELKAKMLDWKPEVFETKTRRQSNQVKAVTAYREIFGIDLPEKFNKNAKGTKNKKYNKKSSPVKSDKIEPMEVCDKVESPPPTPTPPPKEVEPPKPLPEAKVEPKVEPDEEDDDEPLIKKIKSRASTPVPPPPKTPKGTPKKTPRKSMKSVPITPSTSKKSLPVESSDDEDYTPSEKEEKLQAELQVFALELLNDNLSWADKRVIQNLVIWEPIDPVPFIPEKKYKKTPGTGKKYKKKKSGMDFIKNGTGGRGRPSSTKSSRDVSRAQSAEPEEVHEVIYTLDNVIKESNGWVIDKRAGETILHRAAKMGYPDVTAYGLDFAKINPGIKDNAGIPPLQKAAFKGHGEVVKILLRYGADPNTNVKGTRPLHEALESGNLTAVYHLLTYGSDPLLYDYSGNMPIDLTEGDEDMRRYLSSILNDLHGKPAERWNVSHNKQFITPNFDDSSSSDNDDGDEFEFDVSSNPLPPYYQLKGREGHWVLKGDLSPTKKQPSESQLNKCTSIELSREEFIKISHCSLLGNSKCPNLNNNVKLYRVDTALKKILGVVDSINIK